MEQGSNIKNEQGKVFIMVGEQEIKNEHLDTEQKLNHPSKIKIKQEIKNDIQHTDIDSDIEEIPCPVKPDPPVVTLKDSEDEDEDLMNIALNESRIQFHLDLERKARAAASNQDQAHPSQGSSSTQVQVLPSNSRSPADIPTLFLHKDPHWTLGNPLSKETHNLTFQKKNLSKLAEEMKEYIEFILPEVKETLYPKTDKITQTLTNKLWTKRPYTSPIKKTPSQILKIGFQKYLDDSIKAYKPRTKSSYIAYMFTG